MTTVAAIQMTSGPSVETNLAHARTLVGEAVALGARLVVLPENVAIFGVSDADRYAVGEADGTGPIQAALAMIAREHRIWLIGGTIPIRAGSNRVRAACVVYDEHGKRVARYDKIHLFDVRLGNGERYYESNGIEPGDSPVVVDTPIGRMGLAVCYDLRFPELFRRLLDEGAQCCAVPSAFTAFTGRAHWETLVRARAIENLAYVIAAAQTGRHPNGRETYGDSMIVNPWGEVLARRAQEPGVVIAECDLEKLRLLRAQLPSVEHRTIRG